MKATLPHQRLRQISHLELIAKQVVEGFITGLHKSPFHGFSVEFAEHRPYNTGESIRYIDWKLYSRTEKLFVKKFEEETNLRCQIIIDNSSSMYYPERKEITEKSLNKISFSVYCAAALIYLLKQQRDAVGLSLFSEKIELHTPAKLSSPHIKILFDELEKLLKLTSDMDNKKTFAAEVLHQIADYIHKRSLVIIFSDMFDNSRYDIKELFSALQHFRHNKHEVILFHIIDKQKEMDFEFENRPYRFIDLETADEIKINPIEIKDRYLQSIHNYRKELILRCGQYNIDFIDADINKDFEQILIPFLIKRAKLY